MKLKKYLKVFFIFSAICFTFNIAFSQSAKKIVYASNNTSSELLQIFVMDEDGQDKKQLTDLDENCYYPKFSSDGEERCIQYGPGKDLLYRRYRFDRFYTAKIYIQRYFSYVLPRWRNCHIQFGI